MTLLYKFGICLITLCLLACSVSLAQTNFVPGHIITIDGDSIAGEIDDQYWSAAPKEIQFRSASGVKTYAPADLLQFGVGNKTLYLSQPVQYDSTSNSKTLSHSFQPTYKQDYLFLRVIVKSKYSLLEFMDDQVPHFFIQQGETFTELVNHMFLSSANGANTKRVNPAFIEQLRSAFKDCSSIEVKPYTGYSEKNLRALFIAYSDCQKVPKRVYERLKTTTTVGLVGLAGFDQMRKNWEGGMGYGGGIAFTFAFPNKLYKMSLYTEIAYRKLAHQFADRPLSQTIPIQSGYTAAINLNSIKTTVLVRNRLDRIANQKLFIEGGFTYSMGLKDEFFYNDLLRGEKAEYFWAFIAGTGVNLGKVILDVRYERGSGVQFSDSPILTSASGLSSLNVGILYQFSK